MPDSVDSGRLRSLPRRLRPRGLRYRAPARLHALHHPRAEEDTVRLFTPSIVLSRANHAGSRTTPVLGTPVERQQPVHETIVQGREHVIRFPTASRRGETERRRTNETLATSPVITLPAAASRIDASTLIRLVDDPEHAIPDLAAQERSPELHGNRFD